MADKTLVNIFWTGGWDSSFRVIELSRLPVTIQPHYILYANRRSHEYELQAIRAITADLEEDPRRQADLLPCRIVRYEDIPADPEISKIYQHLLTYTKPGHSKLGPQYEYLARYARTVGPIEMSNEWGPGIIDDIIDLHGNMDRIDLGNGLVYDRMIPGGDDPDVYTFFRNFLFPIRDISKLDMKRIAEQEGYTATLYKSWFCHYPANGEPCGSCVPCQIVVEQGMSERLSPKAMQRYAFDLRYKERAWYKFYKRVRRKLRGF